MRSGSTEMRRRHHGAKRHLNRPPWIGKEAGNTRKRLIRFGIEHVENGADQQCVAGLLPVIAAFQRSFRVDQHIRDILDIAHLPFAAANFQQWIIGGRIRVGWIEQQHAAVPLAKAGSQGPVLSLDVMDDATARPGQKRRHHQTDALAGSGRREAEHMFRSIMPEVVTLKPAEYDPIR